MAKGTSKVLVVASTFPAHESDPVPAFVRDQIIAMKKVAPHFEFSVLAPHDPRSSTVPFSRHEHYNEHRFHYFWPHRFETLAGRGIMPALKANPLNYLLIPFLFMGELWALYRLARKLKPSTIYAHWFTPQAITAFVVSKATGTRFVFTTHAADVDVWRKIPFVGRLVVRSIAPKASALTAVSRRSMAKLESFFSEQQWRRLSNKTKIIPMGVDLPAVGKSSTRPTSRDILFVGRLAEKKGVQHLLPAYKSALPRLGEAKLIIAGDGPWLDKLKQQATSLGLGEKVEFAGYVTGSDKTKLIESAHTYVVPSIITDSGDAEGLPVSLMEGLAFGKICIATNESGADDIITHGTDGYLLDEKDTDTLAELLVAATKLTDKEYADMSAAARATAKQFAWPHVAQQHIDFLFTKEAHV